MNSAKKIALAAASFVHRTDIAMCVPMVDRFVSVTMNALATDLPSVVATTKPTSTSVNFGSSPVAAAQASSGSTMANASKPPFATEYLVRQKRDAPLMIRISQLVSASMNAHIASLRPVEATVALTAANASCRGSLVFQTGMLRWSTEENAIKV